MDWLSQSCARVTRTAIDTVATAGCLSLLVTVFSSVWTNLVSEAALVQISHFGNNQQYNQLLSSATVLDPELSGRVPTTLPCRWDGGELSLHDVGSRSIYHVISRGSKLSTSQLASGATYLHGAMRVAQIRMAVPSYKEGRDQFSREYFACWRRGAW